MCSAKRSWLTYKMTRIICLQDKLFIYLRIYQTAKKNLLFDFMNKLFGLQQLCNTRNTVAQNFKNTNLFFFTPLSVHHIIHSSTNKGRGNFIKGCYHTFLFLFWFDWYFEHGSGFVCVLTWRSHCETCPIAFLELYKMSKLWWTIRRPHSKESRSENGLERGQREWKWRGADRRGKIDVAYIFWQLGKLDPRIEWE